MRILLVQDRPFFGAYGGADKSDRMLMAALAREGYSCTVIAKTMSEQGESEESAIATFLDRGATAIARHAGVAIFRSESVEVHAVFKNIREYIKSFLRNTRPDYVIVSTDAGHGLLTECSQAVSAKIIYLARTTMLLPFGPDSAYPSKKMTDAIRRTDAVIAVSQYMANYIIKHSGIRAIHLPIQLLDLEEWPLLGSPLNPYITMVNPCNLKGISIFLGIADALPDLQFAAVPTWGTNREDLVSLRRRSNVRIIEPVDDIRSILHVTRIMLVPSLWNEGRGRIVVEALLGGVPVVASRTGGLIEASLGVAALISVTPIESYLDKFDDLRIRVPVVPKQNIEPWIAAVRKLVGNESYYAKVSASSREVARNYAASVSIRPFIELLQSLMSER
jgi:glycosyltransferase involved in cell wall biosynthesis